MNIKSVESKIGLYDKAKSIIANPWNRLKAAAISALLIPTIFHPHAVAAHESPATVFSGYTLDGIEVQISCVLRATDYACGLHASGWDLSPEGTYFSGKIDGQKTSLPVGIYKGDLQRGYKPAHSAQVIVSDTPDDSNTLTVSALNRATGVATMVYVYL